MKIYREEVRDSIYSSGSLFRKYVFAVLSSKYFDLFILVVILVNAVLIGLQTSQYVEAKAGQYMYVYVHGLFGTRLKASSHFCQFLLTIMVRFLHQDQV